MTEGLKTLKKKRARPHEQLQSLGDFRLGAISLSWLSASISLFQSKGFGFHVWLRFAIDQV